MTIKPNEINYPMPENVIAALKQANREKDATIDSFVEANVKLRQKTIKLTKIMTMMEATIIEAKQKLHEVVERHTL